MNKSLRFMLVSLLTFVVGSIWAADVYYTLDTTVGSNKTTNNTYTGSGTITVDGIEWALEGNGTMNPWRIGGKSITDADRAVYTKTAMDAAINSIDLTVGTANSITVNSLKLIVASDADFANVIDEVTRTFVAESKITFEPTAGTSWANDAYYKFAFNVTVSGSSNKFVQFSKVEFMVESSSAPSVAKPVFSPAGGTFWGSQEVSLTCETDGAAIYYTLDGTDPTTESTAYTAPFTVTETTTVRAIAVKDAELSDVATATYTKLEVITLADAQAAEAGTMVAIEGTVVASSASGAVLSDGTDYIYYYNNNNVLTIGQKVRMIGALSTYGGAKQMSATAQITELGTEEVSHPAATELTGEDMDAIYTEKVAERKYVSFTGTLNISGNYYNITVAGAETAVGSITKPNEDISFLNGQNVKVTGYLMYVSNKYVYTVATSVEEVFPEGIITVNGRNYQITGENIIANGSFDDGVTGWYAGAWAAANASNYTIVTEGGFDGGAYLQYSAGGVAANTNIRGKWNVEIGKTYLFRCYTSGKTPDSNNLQYSALRIYDESKTNYEGDALYQLKWGAAAGQSTDAWTENNFIFTATSEAVTFRSSWTSNAKLDGFQLYALTPYYSVTSFHNTLVEAQAALNNEDYATVTGEERTALSNAINTYKDATSETYEEAINALDAAKTAFVNAKAAYDAYAAAQEKLVDLPYALAEKKPVAETATTAADAQEKTAALYTALRAYYESNALAEGVDGAVNMTSLIANPDATDGNNGWTWTGSKNNPASNEPWTDAAGNSNFKYFDGGNWGANSWTTTMSQAITIPAGRYLLTAKGRAATNTTLTMAVGENVVEMPNIGSAGNVFDRGWGDAYVEFSNPNGDAVEILVSATTQTVHEWFSVGNFRLVQLEAYTLPAASQEEITALETAISTAEGHKAGFEKDEYAPFNNITAFQALANAKRVAGLEEKTKIAVTEATQSLNDAEWTANEQEISAIYDGVFAKTEANSTSGDITLPGWTKVQGIRLLVKDTTADPGLEYTDGKAAVFAWGGTTLTYGEQAGYTLPLNTEKPYKLTFKMSGWRDGDLPTTAKVKLGDEEFSAPTKNDNNEVVANSLEGIGRISTTEGNPYKTLEFYFKPTTENPLLTIYANLHFTIADVILMTVSNEEYEQVTGINEIPTIKTFAAEGIYNLNGQKVEKTKKGLYIVNGKKVVMK